MFCFVATWGAELISRRLWERGVVRGEEEGGMHRDRGGSGSRVETGASYRRRINGALDKHLERSSTATSKVLNRRERDRLSVPSTSSGKHLEDQDQRSASLSKNKYSDG